LVLYEGEDAFRPDFIVLSSQRDIAVELLLSSPASSQSSRVGWLGFGEPPFITSAFNEEIQTIANVSALRTYLVLIIIFILFFEHQNKGNIPFSDPIANNICINCKGR
jgi:hypothetical protein